MIEPPASPAPASPWVPAAIAGCTLIWGSTFLFISVGNDTLPPIWAAALRLALASGVLFALTGILRQPLPRGSALQATVWFGLLQFGANFPLLYWAEKSVPSGLAAIVFATIPLQAALLAWRLGLERFSWARIVGGAVALTGISLMFGGELKTRPDPRPLVAVIAATLCANVASLLYKKGPHQPAIPANAVGAALGSVICLGLSRITGEHAIAPPTMQSWGALLYLTFAGSVGAFVLWTWLVNRVPVTRLSFIGVAAPIIALTLGVLVRHERLTGLSAVGAIVVLVGLSLGLEIGGRRKGSGTGRA
jgi:drug/metabolite transporter (DMT)-like permease